MQVKCIWLVAAMSFLALFALAAMADADTIGLSYDFETPRIMFYDVRVLSLQEGTSRNDLVPVQDRRYQMSVKCLGEHRLVCEVLNCRDEYDDKLINKSMRFSLECVASRDGSLTKIREIDHDLGPDHRDAQRAETARYLLRSHLVRALNEITVRLPKEKRALGQSWVDFERSWPFKVTKDSDVVFPFLTLEMLPSAANNFTAEIRGSRLEWEGPSKRFPDLLDHQRTTKGRYTYDSKLKLITEAVIAAEQEGTGSGRDGELQTRFGVVRFEMRLTKAPEPLAEEPKPN